MIAIAFECGPVHPGLTSWGILSRPCGTGLDEFVYPGLRPGLFSTVPTGLIAIWAKADLFSASALQIGRIKKVIWTRLTLSRPYGTQFGESSLTQIRPAYFTGNEGWVPHCPDFLWRLVALMHSMRLSLMKGAHADLSSTAWQEIGVKPRFGLSGIHSTPRAGRKPSKRSSLDWAGANPGRERLIRASPPGIGAVCAPSDRRCRTR
jgi:hypothetical protein